MSKKPTPQRLWQLNQIEKGLCIKCNAPAEEGKQQCPHHGSLNREAARLYYRARAGIPPYAPLHTRAKRKKARRAR